MAGRRVTYAFGGALGGGGIGRIAGYAAAGADRHELLARAICYTANEPRISPTRTRPIRFGKWLNRIPSYELKDGLFDRLAARLLDNPALFHGWNNMCRRSLAAARRTGAVTVVERASSHPAVQRRLVEQELEHHGDGGRFINDRQLNRMVAELEAADAVFVPSEFVYESFIEEGFDESRLHLLRFGVDVERFSPTEGATTGSFNALFVGQVSLRKGIQYLLPAWRAADVDGTLRLAGSVTDDAEPIVDRYRGDPDIEFLGWVDDMAREYRRASAFVFPSIEEGSALVSYEAMAAGLPSVVTPNVGSLVADGEHGVVVPPRAIDALADAIATLAGDPELRAAYGRAARERVEPYTWDRYGDRVAETYRDLLA